MRRAPSPERLARLLAEWRALPFAATCGCASCKLEERCHGRNPSSRICLTCFVFVFRGKAPNMRRRKRQQLVLPAERLTPTLEVMG